MPRRWVWSLLDIVALIALGQATILAQRQASLPPPRLDAVVEFARAEADAGRFGTRIFEASGSVVVAVKLPGQGRPVRVTVEDGLLRFGGGGGEPEERIPVPARADPSRYSVRREGDELRVTFAKAALTAGD